jgi:hypothetical protein
MKFRDRTTGDIYTLFDLQQKFSNVSFPLNWDTTTYDFANVDPVIVIPEPTVGIHNRAEYGGIQLINGIWTDVWNEVPRYDDPTEQAQWVLACTESKWEEVRVERNRLLSETDYTQLSDTPITPTSRAAFATYRQTLRDVTAQTDPYNIVWPTPPIYEKE